jgi:glutaredoxin
MRIALHFAAVAKRCLALLLLLLALPASAAEHEPAELQVFVRDGCPHCAEAKAYLPLFGHTRPWLRIVYRSVDHDAKAREELVLLSQSAGIWPPGVPTFVFQNRMLIGFESAERTGPELAALVEQRVTPAENIESRWFGTLSVARLGLPLFTLAVGLLDGFNPCAMWLLLFLLSLLVHLQDRKRMALVAGTFVLMSGVVYYAFMAAWLNLFLAIGLSTPLRIALGGLALFIGSVHIKDFFTHLRGFSLSIPESAKPGLYARMRAVVNAPSLLPALAAVSALALVVNFVELTCTAGFPALYTAILTQHALMPSAHYAYLGLYILGYIADDALMVASAVIALSSRKLTQEAGRWLKLLSGGVMLALGAIMLLRPAWLL